MNGSPAEMAMRALVTVRAFELTAVDPLLSRLLDPSEHARAGNFTDESAPMPHPGKGAMASNAQPRLRERLSEIAAGAPSAKYPGRPCEGTGSVPQSGHQ